VTALAGEPGSVYLLHLDPPLCQARRYLGWARELEPRLGEHRAGRGSPLIAAAVASGSRIELARTWENVDRHFERALKNRHEGSRLCPLCVRAGRTAGRGLLEIAPPEVAA
jgi:hypothetical protein